MTIVFSPEDQYKLYVAVRDGDIALVASLLQLESPDSHKLDINGRYFESLWHEPGEEATILHLAACCIQLELVQWLLDHGANPNIKASNYTVLDVVGAHMSYT